MIMQTEIDTIKIQMSVREAKEFSRQMNELFNHFCGAVNAVGMTNIEQLMLDYPAVSEFYQMIRIYERKNDEPVW